MRDASRRQIDLMGAEWAPISGFLPQARAIGRAPPWPLREIMNATFYVPRGGIAWRLLPADLPPWQTVYRWFARLRDEGVFERLNQAVVMANCQRVGREASPRAAIIGSHPLTSSG